MKIKNFLSLITCCVIFTSCSSEELDETTIQPSLLKSSNLAHIEGRFIEQKDNMLCFNNYEEFNQLVQSLEENQQITDGQSDVFHIEDVDKSLNIEGFTSIYDDYVSALKEADNYYDSKIHYEEFKSKYSNLYFPEYKDDYSAYLPVSDRNIAKLLNSNGEVIINNEIVNMKDVSTYDRLVELGETMSENSISFFDYTGDYKNGFPRLENGGDRSLQAKVYTKPGSNGVGEVIIVEVIFRKKGAFGAWYNYSSNTTLSWDPGESWSKSGTSSHDYKFARKYNNGPIPFKGRMFVEFQGFRGEKVFFNVDI